MTSRPSPRDNSVLAALPEADYQRLLPYLESVELSPGTVLHEPERKINYLYFLTSGVVSRLYMMESGETAEVALTGREGVIGTALFLGANSAPNRAVVLCAGHAYRLKASVLRREFEWDMALRHALLFYTQALITQMAQTVVCSRRCTVEQLVCRLLLMTLDRLDSNELVMTQEQIAELLGVRREGVTEAARKLQAEGSIRYRRGHITIVDRRRLESRACDCYSANRKEYMRLVSGETYR